MVEEILIRNETLNQEIKINLDENNKFILEPKETEWGEINVSHKTTNFPNQIGKYLVNTVLGDRDVSIVGYVIATGISQLDKTYEEFYMLSEKQIEQSKMVLSKILNPLYNIEIIAGDYLIIGRPDMSISFSNSYEENNEIMCKFMVDIYCPEGLFYYRLKTENVVAGVIPSFYFPLTIYEDAAGRDDIEKGIIFGIKNEGTLVQIKNEGDVEIGATIIVEALTDVTNLKIYNDITGEFFKINKKLSKGEIIVINTEMGNQKIEGHVSYHKYNYFKYVDSDSDWLQFKPGISVVGYTSDEGNSYGLVDIKINIQGKYYSFPNM